MALERSNSDNVTPIDAFNDSMNHPKNVKFAQIEELTLSSDDQLRSEPMVAPTNTKKKDKTDKRRKKTNKRKRKATPPKKTKKSCSKSDVDNATKKKRRTSLNKDVKSASKSPPKKCPTMFSQFKIEEDYKGDVQSIIANSDKYELGQYYWFKFCTCSRCTFLRTGNMTSKNSEKFPICSHADAVHAPVLLVLRNRRNCDNVPTPVVLKIVPLLVHTEHVGPTVWEEMTRDVSSSMKYANVTPQELPTKMDKMVKVGELDEFKYWCINDMCTVFPMHLEDGENDSTLPVEENIQWRLYKTSSTTGKYGSRACSALKKIIKLPLDDMLENKGDESKSLGELRSEGRISIWGLPTVCAQIQFDGCLVDPSARLKSIERLYCYLKKPTKRTSDDDTPIPVPNSTAQEGLDANEEVNGKSDPKEAPESKEGEIVSLQAPIQMSQARLTNDLDTVKSLTDLAKAMSELVAHFTDGHQEMAENYNSMFATLEWQNESINKLIRRQRRQCTKMEEMQRTISELKSTPAPRPMINSYVRPNPIYENNLKRRRDDDDARGDQNALKEVSPSQFAGKRPRMGLRHINDDNDSGDEDSSVDTSETVPSVAMKKPRGWWPSPNANGTDGGCGEGNVGNDQSGRGYTLADGTRGAEVHKEAAEGRGNTLMTTATGCTGGKTRLEDGRGESPALQQQDNGVVIRKNSPRGSACVTPEYTLGENTVRITDDDQSRMQSVGGDNDSSAESKFSANDISFGENLITILGGF